MPEHLDCILETAGIQYALGIWRIYSVPVGFCGSTAGQLDLADPLFYRYLFADLLRIDLADLLHAPCILRIHCRPVRSCRTTVLQVFVCGSTADRRRARRSIRLIYCGPVEFWGSTVGLYLTTLADLLRSCRILLKLLEIRCGADLRAYQSCFLISWIRHAK